MIGFFPNKRIADDLSLLWLGFGWVIPSHIMWANFIGICLLVLFLGPQTASSQEPPCTMRKVAVSFRDAENLPLQNISVTDLEGVQ